MGQFSMEKCLPPGSVLSGNQHVGALVPVSNEMTDLFFLYFVRAIVTLYLGAGVLSLQAWDSNSAAIDARRQEMTPILLHAMLFLPRPPPHANFLDDPGFQAFL